jgi:ribonuclease R
VAEFVGKVKKRGDTQKPFVYRIHDAPQPEKISTFADFAKNFGYRIQADTDRQIAHSINKLMVQIKGKPEENVLEQLAIRTMSKAIYSTENVGHYGLAFDYYTHFTSPIRRYPDVMVHRLLEYYLTNSKPAKTDDLEDKCKHSSQREMTASEAERASVKYKQVQFLQGKEEVIFDGVISGVKEWGIYVEIIENKCEGMIRLRDIDNDFYEFDESNYCIVGSRSGKKYRLGDPVKVQVKRADLTLKQIDFYLFDEDNPGPRKKSGDRNRSASGGNRRGGKHQSKRDPKKNNKSKNKYKR